ncbi:membrane-bound serine protease [Candidatus Scalindua japonica]|uniref:Membrane-bound serine protease n=1 Tax=Candidatus Scalindua japonica TaxID=1284222 RepID=A0A286U4G1_9BACT|nr:NfeD family protein [Candidatus Scalindua japonica]GAX63016.1 membrane-bound serine protease [Candidatus Scalindua japonica]
MSISGIITLYVIGLIAITIELFIPGAIVGICGAGCVITSIIFAYLHISNLLGHILLVIGICFIPIFFITWYKLLTKTFAVKASEKGFASSTDKRDELLSTEGVAITTLRPSGTANINGHKVDVISEGEMILKDTRIKVTEVKGNRIVVRPVKT